MFDQMKGIFSKLKTKNYKYIRDKYNYVIPEYNSSISPKSFIKIFEKDYELAIAVCNNKWTQLEVDYIINLMKNIPIEYLKEIIIRQPEIFKTNILEKIDAKSVSRNPESYYKLYLQFDDKLFELIGKEQPKEGDSSIYLASLYCDLGLEISDLYKIVEIINKNIDTIQPKMEFFQKITDKSTLLNLLFVIKNNNVDKFIEVLDFMKNNNILKIRPEYFSMILNHTSKDSLSKKIKENSDVKKLITEEYSFHYVFDIIRADYIAFTPLDEIINTKSNDIEMQREFYLVLYKIVWDLLKLQYSKMQLFYIGNCFVDIEKVAEKNKDNEILLAIKLLKSLTSIPPNSEEYKKIYYQYKDKFNFGDNQVFEKFKEYYCQNLNNGLFNPNNVPDKEGEYENYKVEYIEYKGKKIKKIVLWDPNFYMDISNIVSWEKNDFKDSKIKELSQKVISNPNVFGYVNDGSNTNCTTLINAMQMGTFAKPVVTGGYSYIDSKKLILANTGDAGTKDRVPENSLFSVVSSKDSLLRVNQGRFNNGTYNEVTSLKNYSIDNHSIRKHVFDYMLLNLGVEKELSYEDTLNWASTYDIPVVELDCKKIYKYYEEEIKKYIEKCHNSSDIFKLNDCIKIIDLIRVLRTFGQVNDYVMMFKESFEYALNLENKKTFFTQENINEISLILQFLKKINEFQYDEWINKLEQELDNLIKIDGKEVKKNK